VVVIVFQQRGRGRTVHAVVECPRRCARRTSPRREHTALARAVATPGGGNVLGITDARGVSRHSPRAFGISIHHTRLIIVVDVILIHRTSKRVLHPRAQGLCETHLRFEV
jgi:hypothetical protein